MKRRTFTPCRECGKTHNNPKSSSICDSCGATERRHRLKEEEEILTPMDKLNECESVEELKDFIRDHLL